MRKIVARAAIIVVGLIGMLAAAVYFVTESRFAAVYEAPAVNLTISRDPATIARGKQLSNTRGCVDCHGQNLAGTQFLDVPILARLYATNLTSGPGGIGGSYTIADWDHAIRHGLRPDGKPLLFMPSHEFYPLSDTDLAALVSYLVTVPAAAGEKTPNRVGPLGRVLIATGQIPQFLSAEVIDHMGPRPTAPPPGVTVEYGGYLATGCVGCHGEQYSGGPIPGAPPEMMPPPNLTPHETGLAGWSESDFFRVIREGIRPDGAAVSDQMPWRGIGQLSDDELRALWLFLENLPPVAEGNR